MGAFHQASTVATHMAISKRHGGNHPIADVVVIAVNRLMTPPTPANPDLEVNFSNCRFADAEIVSVRSSHGDVEVEYLDWQERAGKLIFKDAVGYESFSPEGVSLSHGTMSDDDPLIARACRAAEEDEASDFFVFSFVSA